MVGLLLVQMRQKQESHQVELVACLRVRRLSRPLGRRRHFTRKLGFGVLCMFTLL